MSQILRHRIPNTVFVPFEWDGKKWIKRDDLPRFLDTQQPVDYWCAHQEILWRDGKPVLLQWIECSDYEFIKEFLQGVGQPRLNITR